MSDPWHEIGRPTSSAEFLTRRCEADHPWDFHWGRDVANNVLILLEYSADLQVPRDLPNLAGLTIQNMVSPSNRRRLVLILREGDQKDIFHRLCTDLLEATRSVADERQAISTTVSRLWRWQNLLRRGRLSRLSDAEQRGLVGELLFLAEVLVPRIGPMRAVEAWRSPVEEEGNKDFLLGDWAVEVKTRSSNARADIVISSPEQLDDQALEHLFLAVFVIAPADPTGDGAMNLGSAVGFARRAVEECAAATAQLDQKLLAAGYQDVDDYSDTNMVVAGRQFFKVGDAFPRLLPSNVPGGLRHVRYNVDLNFCETFRTDEDEVINALGLGEENGK